VAEPLGSRRYRSLHALQRDNARCRLCVEAGFPLGSWPVFEGRRGQRAYLLGQAPGVVEGEESRPWRGRAGRTLRGWLRLDEDAFYETFYCASVTRCYPGKAADGRGDRLPTPAEQALCERWRRHELRLLEPELVVTVGALAARRLLGAGRLTDAIGKSFLLEEAIVVPLPHPSGASGWLNDRANRARLGKALTHVHRELQRIDGGDRAADPGGEDQREADRPPAAREVS
jgi:uracil-DNA glycosylase